MRTPETQDNKEAPRAVLVWFRLDLRLRDNPALVAATQTGRPIIPVYVLDDETGRPIGAAARWWLHQSLAALDKDLRSRGSRLILLKGEAGSQISRLADQVGAGALFWNRLYEASLVERDRQLKARLKGQGVEANSFAAGLLNEPWTVLNKAGEAFKVFTAYWRTARERGCIESPLATPTSIAVPEAWPDGLSLADLNLLPSGPDWSTGFVDWAPGEDGAQARLAQFIDHGLDNYRSGRDRPGVEGSSRLSPHLHFGEISPRQIWGAVQTAAERGEVAGDQVETFLSELGWRDFNHALMFHRPDIARRPMKPSLDNVQWRSDPQALRAWTRGQTGYPLVDAGMRQLWRTGWMHNRVRMVVASFLVKHLLIDWREGEAWFWDTLVDADAANNAGNWQWVAGCGADAQPWFRVFNPVLQGEKFDPAGDYVRRFVPELAGLPARLIHRPWAASATELTAANLVLGRDYPFPIVDHSCARRRALEALTERG